MSIPYKLREWINVDKLDWIGLSKNPSPGAIQLLDNQPDKIYWPSLLQNTSPEVKYLIEKYIEKHVESISSMKLYESKTNWNLISMNPHSKRILEKYPGNIAWNTLSANTSEWAMELLEKHPEKIDYDFLSTNKSSWAMELLEKHPKNIEWGSLSENPCSSAQKILQTYPEKIVWVRMARNKSVWAVQMMEEELYKNPINSQMLWMCYMCMNPYARTLLENHIKKEPKFKIHYGCLSQNPSEWAVKLLEEECERNPEKNNIDWYMLVENPCPLAMDLLEKKYLVRDPEIKSRNLYGLSANPNIFVYDYQKMKEPKNQLHEDLIQTMFHPRNMERFDGWGFDIEF
jgi:hypothetical protein